MTRSPVCLILGLTFAFLSQSAGGDEVDWKRARELHRKAKSGQQLTPKEQEYLNSAMEARRNGVHRQRPESPPDNATRGDGHDSQHAVDPIRISDEQCPVRTLQATAEDGNKIKVAYRVPPADRALPAVIFLHGGLGQRHIRPLTADAMNHPTHTRFLKEGFVSVSASFRTYGREPLSRGPILDAIAIVQAVKKLPNVDPQSVVAFGGSGGGSIALELAGEPKADVAAIIAGEPATVLYTGIMTEIAVREKSMRDFPTRYTDRHRAATNAKIRAISCPILIHHGDTHPLKDINFQLVFPAIEQAGKSLTVRKYPGEHHGFYWGNHTTAETVDAVINSSLTFLSPLLKTKPAKLALNKR